MARSLHVDSLERAAELERFWRYVVKGPGDSCWLWTGSIADDGYGRFWIKREGKQSVVRPHRYAFAAVTGTTLGSTDVVMHHCDEPICCRADVDAGLSHLQLGTQADNLATMGRRGRGGGMWWNWRWRGTDRKSLAARSRALREAVRDGWDEGRIQAAVTNPGGTLPLFELDTLRDPGTT